MLVSTDTRFCVSLKKAEQTDAKQCALVWDKLAEFKALCIDGRAPINSEVANSRCHASQLSKQVHKLNEAFNVSALLVSCVFLH